MIFLNKTAMTFIIELIRPVEMADNVYGSQLNKLLPL